jgi:penicillin-binding protein 2
MKRQDANRRRRFSRRAAVLGTGKLALMALLGSRLYYLQVVEAPKYRVLADENRINLHLLAPPRGRILDRFGIELAQNRQNYRLVIVPEQARETVAVLDSLANFVPLEADERQRILSEIARRRPFVPITVREHLSWWEVAEIEVNAPYLPGISIDEGRLRQYPQAASLAHVLGYVAAVAPEELTGDPLLELPEFRIGKNGVEKFHDLSLRGRAGSQQVEVNAHGRIIRELGRSEGNPGADVQLTLDQGLQTFATDRLAAESASAVVLDVADGAVLTLASTPSFDPNLFNQGLTHRQWRELVDNPRAPLINKTISGQYPPGSTFKLAVAVAALESGVLGAGHSVYCPGHMKLGNRRFHCWKRGGHGRLGMVEALAQSCDVYFYDIALKVGIKRIAETAHKLGLGNRLGIDLPSEADGLIPTPAWKLANWGSKWHQGETLNTGIGQGFVLTTPLQLAVMCARIANGGLAITPRLTQAVRESDGDDLTPPPSPPPKLDIPARALALVREGMGSVVNHRRGTAYAARIEDEAWAMAGKTGTSQVRRITKAERDAGITRNEDRPWKHRDHALFVGFAPLHAPRYACAVVVEHGGGGSTVAAPMVRDILAEAQRRDSARQPLTPPAVAAADDRKA